MTRLTVMSRGQVTFSEDLLQHMGIRPGQEIEVDRLPDGRIALRAAPPVGTIDEFIGRLSRRTLKAATQADLQDAAAAGWAGED